MINEMDEIDGFTKVDKPIISAHRGGAELNPENTEKAFDYVILETNYTDAVEFDIRLTKDNVAVIIHDDYIDECEKCKACVKNMPNSVKEFKSLEHRMEFVTTINSVSYYNDSIATIPASTINAVNALGNVNTIFVGGNDRGVDLSELIEFLRNHQSIENIICLPKTGEYIKEGLNGENKNIVFFDELKEAVEYAKKVTKPNTICLLSPAASSYGYFKNFEERGKLFKQYVMENN